MRLSGLGGWLFFGLAACTPAADDSGGDSGGGGSVGDDTGDPDTADPDTGDTGGEETGTTGGSFSESFDDGSGIDTAASTGIVRDGWLVGEPMHDLLDVGDGTDGVWTATADESLTETNYTLVSAAIDAGNVTAPGDLELLVQDGFSMADGTTLTVGGALTIVADGPIDICGDVTADGPIVIHNLSATDATTIGCGTTYNEVYSTPASGTLGNIDLLARGPLVLENTWVQGATLGTAPAPATIVAGGDLDLLDYAGIDAGVSDVDGGGMMVRVKGDLNADGGQLYSGWAGTAATGGDLTMEVQGDMNLYNSAQIFSVDGGTLFANVAGRAFFTDYATIYGDAFDLDAAVDFTANDLLFETYGSIYATHDDGGGVTVRTTGDAVIYEGGIWAYHGSCGPGGNVLMEVGGNLDVAHVNGSIWAGHGNCASPGGDVTANVGGTFSNIGEVSGGRENPSGPFNTPVINEGVTVTVDSSVSFEQNHVIVSLPLSTGAGQTIDEVTLGDAGQFPGRALVEISPDGSDGAFVAVPLTDPITLQDGWKWRVTFTDDLLDYGAIDAIELSW